MMKNVRTRLENVAECYSYTTIKRVDFVEENHYDMNYRSTLDGQNLGARSRLYPRIFKRPKAYTTARSEIHKIKTTSQMAN